jgi:hypothetical protein
MFVEGTLNRTGAAVKPATAARCNAALSSAALASVLMLAPTPARALDGCLVLLCLAAPSWRAIPQCVPPITQLFRDLARGRPFPSCGMAGAGNSARHAWAHAPDFCPPQYSHFSDASGVPSWWCDYTGGITVSIDGAMFSRTWWRLDGDAVTEFSAAAKAQLGSWDTRFDDDYAAWLAALPPPPMDAQ